ncbi:ABC transporter ATP-binding protein [Arenibaculum pallidiluteum]|uniref:ABC transporter ATP-binding protein n=1 Tax=Arenibaculum pallidiluteum TaxID=2812559 RepID=UPI001A957A53|nr:ABC transporter ATP-binding protein [Arenibaculum pallidiluteum]
MGGDSLSARAVVVEYGSVPVLKGVSIDIAPGEFVALLGSSGCGKTTLLRAVSGFVKVRSGSIHIAGRDVTSLPPERRDVAMVFQSYALWPHMTAAENLAYGLRIRKIPRAERDRRVAEVLEMLGLGGLGDRPVTQLSGGQRQRVALGRALAVNPRMLLLDEPLSNLDARIREVVRHEIKALQTRLGITAVHVTHDREEAMVMADRIAIMEAGGIAQLGTPEDIYLRPRSPFVADFMGASNVVPLTVGAAGDGHIRVEPGPDHDAAELPVSAGTGQPGVHLCASGPGTVRAHFRSEAVSLVPFGQDGPGGVLLRGRIAQASYPGGFYRYAVEVGARRFLVDDARRLSVGEAVGVAVPPSALHLYDAQPS